MLISRKLHLAMDFYSDDGWEVQAVWSPLDMKALVTEGHEDQARLLREIHSCNLVYGGPYWNGDLL